MEWNDLVTDAATDIESIIDLFRNFVESRGCYLGIDRRRLAHQILRYVQLRSTVGEHEISNPRFTVTTPPGWSKEKEQDWTVWIHHTFRLEDWQTEVMDPVFGTDERWWEGACSGWREEIFVFLPWWIKRFVVVNEEEVDDKKEDDRDAKIDPYVLEHGNAKQRRNMMKG
jgi:hypothetical protein